MVSDTYSKYKPRSRAQSAQPYLPSADELVRLRRWRVSTFWVMLVGYIGYYIVRGNLAVALPLLSQALGYSNTDLAVILTFSELAYAFGKFTTGPLADQMGGKRIFMIGMVGGVLFNSLFPLYTNLVYFTVIWCCVRFFLSMGWGGIIKTIGAWYEPERNGTIMGVISINFQFGAVIASLFCGALIYFGVGWKGLFYWPAVVVALMALISYFASKESPQALYPGVRFGQNAGEKKPVLHLEMRDGKKASALVIIRQLLKVPLFRRILVFSFLIHILRSFFMFWIPKFMVDMGMGNVNAAFSSAVFPFVGCLGTIALGWYTDRYAKNGNRTDAMWKMLACLIFCLAAIAIVIPTGARHESALVLLLGAAGLFLYGPYSMSAGCLSLDIAGAEAAGTCTGMIDGVGYIGGAIAAWGAGAGADAFGWAQVFWILTGCAVVTTAWVAYMSWAHEITPPTPSNPAGSRG